MTEAQRESPLSPVVYPSFAESYLGKRGLEYLRLLDAVLEPYEHLLNQDLSIEQITVILEREGMFEDLQIVEEIADAIMRQLSAKQREFSKRKYDFQEIERRIGKGLNNALMPESSRRRGLRNLFVGEVGKILELQALIDLIHEAESESPANPELWIKEVRTKDQDVNFSWRMAITLSSWIRQLVHSGQWRSVISAPKDYIEGLENESSVAMERLKKFRVKKTFYIGPGDNLLGNTQIRIDPARQGVPFGKLHIQFKTPGSVPEWTEVLLCMSAISGDWTNVYAAGKASMRPIFEHHGCGNIYEYLKCLILKNLANRTGDHPDFFEEIELPEVYKNELDPGDTDTEHEAEPEFIERAQAVIHEELTKQTEEGMNGRAKKKAKGSQEIERHLRGLNINKALGVLTNMGYRIFEGTKHTRIAGQVDGKMRIRNINTHVSKDRFADMLNEVLKTFKIDRSAFLERYGIS